MEPVASWHMRFVTQWLDFSIDESQPCSWTGWGHPGAPAPKGWWPEPARSAGGWGWGTSVGGKQPSCCSGETGLGQHLDFSLFFLEGKGEREKSFVIYARVSSDGSNGQPSRIGWTL